MDRYIFQWMRQNGRPCLVSRFVDRVAGCKVLYFVSWATFLCIFWCIFVCLLANLYAYSVHVKMFVLVSGHILSFWRGLHNAQNPYSSIHKCLLKLLLLKLSKLEEGHVRRYFLIQPIQALRRLFLPSETGFLSRYCHVKCSIECVRTVGLVWSPAL
jgi:hypothetical protein